MVMLYESTQSCLPFPEEPLEALDCGIPLLKVNRGQHSPQQTVVFPPKATLPSHSAALQLYLYGMLLCSPLSS